METINLFSTKRPVSKAALEEAIKGTKGAIWHQSINKVRGNEYPFHQIFITHEQKTPTSKAKP